MPSQNGEGVGVQLRQTTSSCSHTCTPLLQKIIDSYLVQNKGGMHNRWQVVLYNTGTIVGKCSQSTQVILLVGRFLLFCQYNYWQTLLTTHGVFHFSVREFAQSLSDKLLLSQADNPEVPLSVPSLFRRVNLLQAQASIGPRNLAGVRNFLGCFFFAQGLFSAREF